MTTPKRKKIGPARSMPTPKLYIVFYFERENGDSGFGNVVVEGVTSIRTQADVVGAIGAVRMAAPNPDFYTQICIISWHTLEG